MSVTAVVRHKGADYNAWRPVYDGLAGLQSQGGVTAESVHRLIGDGNDVLVIHQFDNADTAEAFFASHDLRGHARRRHPRPPADRDPPGRLTPAETRSRPRRPGAGSAREPAHLCSRRSGGWSCASPYPVRCGLVTVLLPPSPTSKAR